MAHIRAVSSAKAVVQAAGEPAAADAKLNLLNSLYWSMQDFWAAKKTATPR
jgi:hypothetical protein